MRMRAMSFPGPLALALLTSALLAACGGGGGDESPTHATTNTA